MVRPVKAAKSSQPSPKTTKKNSAKAPRRVAKATSPENSSSKSLDRSKSPTNSRSAPPAKSESASPKKGAEKIVVENAQDASLDNPMVSQPASKSNAAENEHHGMSCIHNLLIECIDPQNTRNVNELEEARFWLGQLGKLRTIYVEELLKLVDKVEALEDDVEKERGWDEINSTVSMMENRLTDMPYSKHIFY